MARHTGFSSFIAGPIKIGPASVEANLAENAWLVFGSDTIAVTCTKSEVLVQVRAESAHPRLYLMPCTPSVAAKTAATIGLRAPAEEAGGGCLFLLSVLQHGRHAN